MSADLIETIRAYWRQRGYEVDVGMREVTEATPTGGVFKYHAVRSNMVNGLPRGFRGDLGAKAQDAAE